MKDSSDPSYMDQIEMCGNIIWNSGYGWGQQRHNKETPAHITGWSYINKASNYSVHDNIFGPAAYRMLHLVALEESSCPQMYNNTYIQNLGGMLGQYGANSVSEPPILPFDENVEETIKTVFGDENATVYTIKK